MADATPIRDSRIATRARERLKWRRRAALRWGEAPHAFVVLRQGARADESELREFARANLAHFKAPHSVTFIKELPKTATGKIQKYVLRARQSAIAAQ